MITSLAERIISGTEEQADDDVDAGKKSLLGSFDLKSLLAKKPKAEFADASGGRPTPMAGSARRSLPLAAGHDGMKIAGDAT